MSWMQFIRKLIILLAFAKEDFNPLCLQTEEGEEKNRNRDITKSVIWLVQYFMSGCTITESLVLP